MHSSKTFSRYSIFNFRNLCEITGFNPDGSPLASNLPSVSAGPFNRQPAREAQLAVFNHGAAGLVEQTGNLDSAPVADRLAVLVSRVRS